MLCISISESLIFTSALAGITKHGICSKYSLLNQRSFQFYGCTWINELDVVTDILVVCGCSPGMMRSVMKAFSHLLPNVHSGTRRCSPFCTNTAHTDIGLTDCDHKMTYASRSMFKHQVWMKIIPEKNLFWNRKSETAAVLCLSWVISSLYSLIIDTALIRMTDPNVALSLCFFFFGVIFSLTCKQAACQLTGVFMFARSWEIADKNRFHSFQSTRYSLNQAVLQRNQNQVLLQKEYAANSQWKHWFYCIFLALNATKGSLLPLWDFSPQNSLLFSPLPALFWSEVSYGKRLIQVESWCNEVSERFPIFWY